MTKKNNESEDFDLQAKLGSEIGRAEKFVTKNKKVLSIVAGAIIVIVGGWVGFKQLIVAPQEKEAQAALFVVQQQFEQDSFNLVVNGNGTDLSALDIIDEYGFTKAANLASFMAGVSYLRLGDFESAYDYLNKFKSSDDIIGPFAIGLKGDALVEQGDIKGGVDLYMKAAKKGDNELVTPYFLNKAGIAYTALGQHEDARKVYQRIKDEFNSAPESMDIDKYIARATIMAAK